EMPGKELVYQKLSLFALLDLRVPEVRRRYRCPIHFTELVDPVPEFGVERSRIRQAEGPAAVFAFGPGYGFVQVRFQMYDGSLSAVVGQLRMVGAMDQVQHDRTRAEIERHVVADMVAWM